MYEVSVVIVVVFIATVVGSVVKIWDRQTNTHGSVYRVAPQLKMTDDDDEAGTGMEKTNHAKMTYYKCDILPKRYPKFHQNQNIP